MKYTCSKYLIYSDPIHSDFFRVESITFTGNSTIVTFPLIPMHWYDKLDVNRALILDEKTYREWYAEHGDRILR